MSNCLFEATYENILSKCKCAPGFHTMGGDEAIERYQICAGANLTCMNDLLNRMCRCLFSSYLNQVQDLVIVGEFDHVDHNGKQLKCMSACKDQV